MHKNTYKHDTSRAIMLQLDSPTPIRYMSPFHHFYWQNRSPLTSKPFWVISLGINVTWFSNLATAPMSFTLAFGLVTDASTSLRAAAW